MESDSVSVLAVMPGIESIWGRDALSPCAGAFGTHGTDMAVANLSLVTYCGLNTFSARDRWSRPHGKRAEGRVDRSARLHVCLREVATKTPSPQSPRVRTRIGVRDLVFCFAATTLVAGCNPPLRPILPDVAPRVEHISAALDESSAERVLIYVDGHFEPSRCAVMQDVDVESARDTVFIRLFAAIASNCSDTASTFRYTLPIYNHPPRLVTIVAGGASHATSTAQFLLPLDSMASP